MNKTLGDLSESESVTRGAGAEDRKSLLQAMKVGYELLKIANEEIAQAYSLLVQSAKLEARLYERLLERL